MVPKTGILMCLLCFYHLPNNGPYLKPHLSNEEEGERPDYEPILRAVDLGRTLPIYSI